MSHILDITGSTVALHHPYKRFITIFPQLYFIILRQIRPEELLPLSARQSRFTSAGKGDKFVSRVNPFVNPFAHPFCSVNPFLAPIKWVNMGLVQPNFAKPSKIIQIAIIQENARNFSFLAFSIRFCCKISISQRLLNCGARRAAFRPYSSSIFAFFPVFTRLFELCLAVFPYELTHQFTDFSTLS